MRMDALEAVGDRAGLEQLHHAIREHLGVNPQILLPAQAEERRVRYRSDPHLQRRTVFDQPRDDLADARFHLRLRLGVLFDQGTIRVDEGGDPIERHHRVSVRPRHLLVDLGDDDAGGIGRRLGRIHGGSQCAETVLVRRGELQERDIETDSSGREKCRDIRKKDGHEIRASLLDRLSEGSAGEERNGEETPLATGLDERRLPGGVNVIKAHAFQRSPPDHRLEKRGRGGGGSVHEDVHPVLNQTDGLFRGNGFPFPIPVHRVSPPCFKMVSSASLRKVSKVELGRPTTGTTFA